MLRSRPRPPHPTWSELMHLVGIAWCWCGLRGGRCSLSGWYGRTRAPCIAASTFRDVLTSLARKYRLERQAVLA